MGGCGEQVGRLKEEVARLTHVVERLIELGGKPHREEPATGEGYKPEPTPTSDRFCRTGSTVGDRGDTRNGKRASQSSNMARGICRSD